VECTFELGFLLCAIQEMYDVDLSLSTQCGTNLRSCGGVFSQLVLLDFDFRTQGLEVAEAPQCWKPRVIWRGVRLPKSGTT
jgi:hypothetical protein